MMNNVEKIYYQRGPTEEELDWALKLCWENEHLYDKAMLAHREYVEQSKANGTRPLPFAAWCLGRN